MNIAIGSDPNADALKQTIIEHVRALGHTITDLGSNDPIYANVAFTVSERVAGGEFERGILVCGTGIGMAIAANKVPGVNAALCSDAYSTERSVKSNNATIMTMGSQVTGPELAKTLVTVWLDAVYDPQSRSGPKVDRIRSYAEANQRTSSST